MFTWGRGCISTYAILFIAFFCTEMLHITSLYICVRGSHQHAMPQWHFSPDKTTVEVLNAVSLINNHQLPRLMHQKLTIIHGNLIWSHHDRKRSQNPVVSDRVSASDITSQQHAIRLGSMIQYKWNLNKICHNAQIENYWQWKLASRHHIHTFSFCFKYLVFTHSPKSHHGQICHLQRFSMGKFYRLLWQDFFADQMHSDDQPTASKSQIANASSSHTSELLGTKPTYWLERNSLKWSIFVKWDVKH